jgi:hypothetical protein
MGLTKMLLQRHDALTDTRLTNAKRSSGTPNVEMIGDRQRFDQSDEPNPRF